MLISKMAMNTGYTFREERTWIHLQKSNYELFNCNNFSIRYWSWNYRGCWHQTRLKSRLTANNRMRALIIETILLLSNFRTSHVGLNQIATVFNPHYDQYVNVDGYDRIARYFANEHDF